MSDTLWEGNGEEPMEYEFLLDFEKYNSEGRNQIQVILANANKERTVPVITTIIPEIKKQICYFGPATLRVTLLHNGNEHLNDYVGGEVRDTISSGTCNDFYLLYKQGYFYEFLVHTTNPQAIGVETNWDGKLVYDYYIQDSRPIHVSGTREYNEAGPDSYYYYKLIMEAQNPNPIILH